VTTPTEFFRWWITDERTGKRRLTMRILMICAWAQFARDFCAATAPCSCDPYSVEGAIVMNSAKIAMFGAIVGLVVAAHAPAVHAETISYSWSGTCRDAPYPAGCGTGRAYALLELQDYTPGTEFHTNNVLSFSYLSDLYDITAQFGFGPSAGTIPAVPFGTPFNTALTILIWDNPAHTSQSIFETFTTDNSFWCFNGCGHDVGINSTFVQVAQVPEPHVYALLGLGLAIGALSRRWRVVPGVFTRSLSA